MFIVYEQKLIHFKNQIKMYDMQNQSFPNEFIKLLKW